VHAVQAEAQAKVHAVQAKLAEVQAEEQTVAQEAASMSKQRQERVDMGAEKKLLNSKLSACLWKGMQKCSWSDELLNLVKKKDREGEVSDEMRSIVSDTLLAFEPLAKACRKTLRHAGVQSLLDLPTASVLTSEDILELLSEVGDRPDDVSLARDVLKLLQSAQPDDPSVHIPYDLLLAQDTDITTVVAKPLAVGVKRIGMVLSTGTTFSAMVMDLETRVVKVYPTRQDGLMDTMTYQLRGNAPMCILLCNIANAMNVAEPVELIVIPWKGDSDDSAVYALMRMIGLVATGEASLPKAGDPAWVDSCQALMFALTRSCV
jgi:hypothetical protein